MTKHRTGAAALRDELVEYRMCGPHDHGLVFGRTPERPFNPSTVWDRARRAWKAANAAHEHGQEPLEPIGLHECRHTFASLMIAAGVNAKALSTFMGHASVAFTLDRYGHLFPGSEDEAAELLDGLSAAGEHTGAPSRARGRRVSGALQLRCSALPKQAAESGRLRYWVGRPRRAQRGVEVLQHCCISRCKRRGRDSNPRWTNQAHNGFRDRRIQPLCHPS